MKEISMEWVEDHHACLEACEWFKGELSGEASMPASKLFSRLEEIDRFDWANWLVVRLMTHEQQIAYAIYAAEQVIGIYEDKYPNDSRPRDAIQAAKTYLEDKTKANKDKVARAAAYAAHADAAAYAAHATYVADSVAHAAAYAAHAAHAAAYAHAAAHAAHDATYAADSAAHAVASSEMRIQILNYGLQLIGMHDLKRAVEESDGK